MKKFVCILLVVVLIFSLAGCHSKTPDGSEISNETREWVSPDGVHYWFWRYWDKSNGWGWVLAPRYDGNGDLVIDGH